MSYKTLTGEQIDQFLKRGHIVLHDCFTRDVARKWTDVAFERLGYQRGDPSTWREARVNMPTRNLVNVREFSPKVFEAACDLMGGEERMMEPFFGDAFIVNCNLGAERSWQPPSAEAGGWHKDGDYFRHFLDSPEQGLLTLEIWTDIGPRGGGTFVACDSVPVVARYLAERPEGVLPRAFDFKSLISQCRDFIEVTARIGDVVLLHPFMLHAASRNHSGIPRLITNPPFVLREPMNFNRVKAEDFSPVELSVLRGLGVERLDFKIAAPREEIVPERVLRQKKMLEEEKSRELKSVEY